MKNVWKLALVGTAALAGGYVLGYWRGVGDLAVDTGRAQGLNMENLMRLPGPDLLRMS
jgi:hypothetical protein